ncbi:MAG: NADH:ubiquinone reductase (Na(+)-transporting) subunit F [Bacteroides sp.]|nr:NADH:ubiquinone reductase (Na(+)-transporting) subunit F [Ruminococcus flavefaciens]MCM1555590.1 NADH:ubiquinone reductase (Na(+)-transporting) subunit F [Bacteroides sp.]
MWSVVLSSVAVFLVVILILVAVLLLARKKLVPQGKVKLQINGEKTLEVDTGNSLLSTLASQKIFLPSACGGKGSCGLCRCRVTEGGGSILPSEKGFFSYREQQQNWRLGCQVKVKGDMSVQIPPEVFGVRKWECEVVSNKNVATFIKEFVVKLPEGENLNFKAGGYIQIDVPACTVNYKDIQVQEEYRVDWDKMKMWDLVMKNPEPCFRAYSMANHPAEGNRIMLNVRIATPPFDRKKGGFMNVNPGICSSYIYSLKPGDKITISGPYGEFFVQDTQREMMFIGGGAGMAPMRSQIFDQFKTRHTSRKASFWYGGRSLKELFYMDEYEQLAKENPNFSFHVALSEPLPEDNWTGDTGFIHQVIFNKYLKNHPEPEEIEYYLCGPKPMTDAVVRMLDSLGVPPEMIRYDNFGN